MKRPREEDAPTAVHKKDSIGIESESLGTGNCSSYIQILGTTTGDSCPSVLVVTETSRYLFNAGDGLQVFVTFLLSFLFSIMHSSSRLRRLVVTEYPDLQRFCNQHQIRLGRLSNLFLTRLHADTMGGLLGKR